MLLSAFDIESVATKIIFEGKTYSPKAFSDRFWRQGASFDSNLSNAGFNRLCGELNDDISPPGQFEISLQGQNMRGTVFC